MSTDAYLFRAESICSGYGGLVVLQDVTLDVPAGSVAALVGRNGAGKTTFADCCAGVIKTRRGKLTLAGADLTRLPANRRVSAGLSYVPSGARCFANLSVHDNLRLAALGGKRANQEKRIGAILGRFERLAERRSQIAGTLSGGERQLLAVARALIQSPRFLILDEPSLGLSPLALRDVLEALAGVVREGDLAVLLVEQNVAMAFDMANKAYVLDKGVIVKAIEEPSAGMAEKVVAEVFFGSHT